jgi:hypothetical protein
MRGAGPPKSLICQIGDTCLLCQRFQIPLKVVADAKQPLRFHGAILHAPGYDAGPHYCPRILFPRIMPVYEKYRDRYFASISNSDRAAGLNYVATVYNGIDLSLYPFQKNAGDSLVFLGRIQSG